MCSSLRFQTLCWIHDHIFIMVFGNLSLYIMYHICSMQELGSQQRQSLLSNGFAKNVSIGTIGHNNNGKRCFLCGLCRDVIRRIVSENLLS